MKVTNIEWDTEAKAPIPVRGRKCMKVTNIEWDTEAKAPIFILENGERRVPNYSPTGSCWVLDWLLETPTPNLEDQPKA